MSIGIFKPPPSRLARGAEAAAAGGLAPGLCADPTAALHRDALQHFAQANLQGLAAAMDQVERWRQDGLTLEDLYIRAIAPCARLLGQWWLDDVLDFAQVTIASSNLQRVLYELSHEFCAPGADQPAGLSVLLATEPQSQHTMGAYMLGEFFRRRGWGVQLAAPQDSEEVLDLLRRNWFDAMGLSVSSERQLPALRALIPRLRRDSPNAGLSIWVGGPLALSQPETLRSLGADMVGGDARDTVDGVHHFVARHRA